MQYFSTRNASERTSPSLALLTGLAPDGGFVRTRGIARALFGGALFA